MSIFRVFLVTLFSCFIHLSFAQQEAFLTVSLTPKVGEGPFRMGFSRLNPNNGADNPYQAGFPNPLDYKGEMEGFEEYILIPNGIQYSYLNHTKGIGSENTWNSLVKMYGEDSEAVKDVSNQELRFFIRIAVKEVTEEEMQIWVDQNANDIWEESEKYKYEKKADDTWETGIARFPIIQVQYEDVVKGQVSKVEVPLQLAPFMSPGNILYAYKSYNEGILEDAKGNRKSIFLNHGFTSNYFVDKNMQVFAAGTEDNWKESNPFTREFLDFGEAVQLGEDKFIISSVNKWGTELKFRKLGANEEWIGTQKGAKAPAIESKTLKGDAYRLYNGKITMLDFWGSWCGPCVGEIPLLRDVVSFFEGDRFELVGLVYDQRETVEKFIEANNVRWKQVMHKYEAEDIDIVEVYNVNAFPTTFLVGEDDKVIVKNDGLRGFQLYKTLCEQLGIPEDDFLAHMAKGDVTLVFEPSDPNISNIHLTGGKFEKQKHYAYKTKDQFVRGYNWESDAEEEIVTVAYMLNRKQETKELRLSKQMIKEGKITINL